ncbi:MAG: hypothetical protein A2W09_09385 [Deltaproteobacteria bacterium RBG_16_50_11]|nr:MAG: hypothetical protein A2W09_09385 [Deltaproteobacteria bacterium RBG_16_50_11]
MGENSLALIPISILESADEIAKKNSLRYVYIENGPGILTSQPIALRAIDGSSIEHTPMCSR